MDNTQKTILLVEDDAILGMIEKKQLENEGYRVTLVNSGEKAIQIVRENIEPIHLILMDINLGVGIDGTVTAREILKFHNLPILFLSSHTEKHIVEKTETITSFGYVVKNASIAVLDASIKMAFTLYDAYENIQRQKTAIEAGYSEMQAANQKLLQTQDKLLEQESDLHAKEKNYHSLFSEMPEAFALHEIICDASGVPVDYRYLDMNPAFEILTNLKRTEVFGKTIRQLFPNTESLLIERYGRVALTGESLLFEDYSIELHRYYRIAAFCPKKGQFAVIFSDITDSKLKEEAVLKG